MDRGSVSVDAGITPAPVSTMTGAPILAGLDERLPAAGNRDTSKAAGRGRASTVLGSLGVGEHVVSLGHQGGEQPWLTQQPGAVQRLHPPVAHSTGLAVPSAA